MCHSKCNRFKYSLINFEKALKIFEQLFLEEGIKKVHQEMLACFMGSHQREVAEKLIKEIHK